MYLNHHSNPSVSYNFLPAVTWIYLGLLTKLGFNRLERHEAVHYNYKCLLLLALEDVADNPPAGVRRIKVNHIWILQSGLLKFPFSTDVLPPDMYLVSHGVFAVSSRYRLFGLFFLLLVLQILQFFPHH